MAARKKKASTPRQRASPSKKAKASGPKPRKTPRAVAGRSRLDPVSPPLDAPAPKASPRKRRAGKKAAAPAPTPVEERAEKPKPSQSVASAASRPKRPLAPRSGRPPKAAPAPGLLDDVAVSKPPGEPAVEVEIAAHVSEDDEASLPPLAALAPRTPGLVRLALGPEVDQSFMLYALQTGKVTTEDRRYEIVRRDREHLRARALKGHYDVTALSAGTWPQVRDRYVILPSGGSFGDNTGPILAARTPIRSSEVRSLEVAVPHRSHSATLALKLWLPRGRLRLIIAPTAGIGLMVRASKVRAGLLVNEDQVTYGRHRLVRIVDLGQWWGESTEGLPLCVSVLAIRRDIQPDERRKIALDIKRSIAYALGHREDALAWVEKEHTRHGGPDIEDYVRRYVNDLTLNCGERGRQALRVLFDRAFRGGLLKEAYRPVFL